MSGLFERAKRRRWDGALAEAEELYRRAYAASPTPERALYLGECLLRRGRWRPMLELLRGAYARAPRPKTADDYTRRFRLAAMALDFESALREAQALPARPDARRAEGLLWLILVDEFPFAARPRAYLRLALRELDAFVARRPSCPWGYYWRGLTRELLPSLRRGAGADLKRAAALARGPYALLKYRWGLEKSDVRLLRAASRGAAPGFWKAQVALADVLLDAGRTKAAARALARLRRISPPAAAPGDAVEAHVHQERLRRRLAGGADAPRERLDEQRWVEASRRPKR